MDFRNTILILTSNLGSQYLVDPVPSAETKKQRVLEAVRTAFKPEFLNRLDDLVVFSALSKEELARIADLQIALLAKRLADRRLTLDITPEALAWLADKGNDPAYGARPLRRLIQTAIGDRLAKEILAGEVVDGDTVRVDRAGDELIVGPATGGSPEAGRLGRGPVRGAFFGEDAVAVGALAGPRPIADGVQGFRRGIAARVVARQRHAILRRIQR